MSPDSDSSYFDWSDDGVCSMLLELRVGNLDLELTNYVYSMQISPIELEFDHNQATMGGFCNLNAKQKHLGCKKSARPIRSHNGYISDQKL